MINYEGFKPLQALEEDAKDVAAVEQQISANEQSISLKTVIEGYNWLHEANLTLESIVND